MTDRKYRFRRIRGWDFEVNVPWNDVIESMRRGVPVQRVNDSPPVNEAHCQCCGSFVGYGSDPERCATCKEADSE